jgi:acid stress-induced BolA-like protein IbaG/YrbA
MEVSQVKQLIEAGLPGTEAKVSGDGYHYEAIVVGDCFDGKSMVQQQKMVYATLNEHITSGALHALTIKTYTPAQWEKAQQFQVRND